MASMGDGGSEEGKNNVDQRFNFEAFEASDSKFGPIRRRDGMNPFSIDIPSNRKPFKCELCKNGYVDKSSLRRHMRNKHHLYAREQPIDCRKECDDSSSIRKIVHYLNRDVDCRVYNVFRELESQIIDNDMDGVDSLQLEKQRIRSSVHSAYKELDLYIYNKLKVLETTLTAI